IYSQANIGAINSLVSLQQNVANQFTFANPAKGIELSGGHQYGGYHYSGGVGFGSSSPFKTLYGRLSYRFNFERDSESRHAIQAAGTTGPHDHTYLTLGSFYLYGKSLQQFPGAATSGASLILSAQEPYYRAGGRFNFNYRHFNMYGVYMYGRDQNLLPIDASGNLIPIPLASESPLPVGFIKSVPAKFNGGFIQADYMIFPWMMAIGRWDGVNSTADR